MPRSIVAFALLSCIACGHTQPTRARVPPDRPAPARVREFVSPYSYEWFVRGELYALRDDYVRAIEAYRMALTSADEDPYVLAHLADALDRSGDRAAAREALQDGLQLDPDSEAIWLARGAIAQRHAEVADAIAAFERAESAAPLSADAPLALSALLRAQGSGERADAVLERFAARSAPGSRAAARAQLELARARDDSRRLEQAARAWLGYAAGEPALAQEIAAELMARDKPALASRIAALLPESERDPRLSLRIALALARTAQVELLLATEPPDRLGGTLEIADAYLRIGRPERALRALEEQASSVEPDTHRRALLLGLALLGKGDAARAAMELARIPAASEFAAPARAALVQALQAGDLGTLAQEVAERGAPEGREQEPQ